MSGYNYLAVLRLEHVHLNLVPYLPLTTLVCFVSCTKQFNDTWKLQNFDAKLRNYFNNEYGNNTLTMLMHEWPINNNKINNNQINKPINNDKIDKHVVIEPICNSPIPIHSDKKHVDAIERIQICNNRDMIKFVLTNWIFVNKYNPRCEGGIRCGSKFADIYIDFLVGTGNANFVYHWASRVCVHFILAQRIL